MMLSPENQLIMWLQSNQPESEVLPQVILWANRIVPFSQVEKACKLDGISFVELCKKAGVNVEVL